MVVNTKVFIIYCITNNITKKQYIGKTETGIISRWNRHVNDAKKGRNSCSALSRAILKYGEYNFTIEEISRAKNSDDLILMETDYIIKYNTLAPNGYNLKHNGNEKLKYTISEDTRKKYRANYYKNFYQYTQTDEFSKLQSKNKQGQKNKRKYTSNYVGITWHQDKNRWSAGLSKNNLGYYNTEEEAAIAYDYAVYQKYGETGAFNFPDKIETYKTMAPPPRRKKSKEGQYLSITRCRRRNLDGWIAIILLEKNKRMTKVFTYKKYENPEYEAFIWRQNMLKLIHDKPS